MFRSIFLSLLFFDFESKIKLMKIVLIINRDDILFIKPLEKFLRENSTKIRYIYFTSVFPVGSNKVKYLLANFRIANWRYLMGFVIKTIISNFLSVFPFSLRFKKNLTLPLLCRFYEIPNKFIKDINNNGFIEELKSHKVSVVFSLTSHIYKKEILNIEGMKFYNFHPSILPENKGRFPIFWAFMNNNDQGFTCHEIVDKIDSGGIINQKKIEIPYGLSIEQIMGYLINFFPEFMEDTLRKIQKGDIEYIKPVTRSFYGPFPTKQDILRYKRKLKISSLINGNNRK